MRFPNFLNRSPNDGVFSRSAVETLEVVEACRGRSGLVSAEAVDFGVAKAELLVVRGVFTAEDVLDSLPVSVSFAVPVALAPAPSASLPVSGAVLAVLDSSAAAAAGWLFVPEASLGPVLAVFSAPPASALGSGDACVRCGDRLKSDWPPMRSSDDRSLLTKFCTMSSTLLIGRRRSAGQGVVMLPGDRHT